MEGLRKKRQSDSVFTQSFSSPPTKKRFKKMSNDVKEIQGDPVDIVEPEEKQLDLAFVMDCTSSMSTYIESAKQNIRKIVEEIVAAEHSDVRLALVEYRDHPPQDVTFVTRSHNFTDSARTMKGWLTESAAIGGGDPPEAVADALRALLELSWRDTSTKVAVCISDAPPHGLGSDLDTFPNGCPDGIDPVQVCRQLAEKGVTLYVVGCEPSITPYKDFFMAMAFITGGQYIPLGRSKALAAVIVAGAREEISLNMFGAEVDAEIEQRLALGANTNLEDVTRCLHERWTSRGDCVNQLQNSYGQIESIETNPTSKLYASKNTLSEIRQEFRPATRQATSVASFGPGPSYDDHYSSAQTVISFAQSSRLVMKHSSKHSL